jgi:hypothetical protein
MNASAPSRGLGPFAALAISLAWLVVLAPLAYPYLKNGQQIAEIKDSYRLLAIAWVSSVGAIIASFSDIARNADRWNPHRAIWFAVRPLTGAAFGAIGYLIYYTIIQLSVAERAQMQGPETPTILGTSSHLLSGTAKNCFESCSSGSRTCWQPPAVLTSSRPPLHPNSPVRPGGRRAMM